MTPKTIKELMPIEVDRENRRVLAELGAKFHLCPESRELFRQLIHPATRDTRLDVILGLNEQGRAWYEVPAEMVKSGNSQQEDPAAKAYRAAIHSIEAVALSAARRKYFPALDDGLRALLAESYAAGTVTTGDGQTRKLFKFLKDAGLLTEEQINGLATKKPTAKKTYLCLSRNPIDMLMISSGQSFSSCMGFDSTHSDAFYMGLPGFICDPNRVLAFMTTGALSPYSFGEGLDIQHFKYIERAWQVATDSGKFKYGRSYPNGPNTACLKTATGMHLPSAGSQGQSLFEIPKLYWGTAASKSYEPCLGYCDIEDIRTAESPDKFRWSLSSSRGGKTPFSWIGGFLKVPDAYCALTGSSRELEPVYTCDICGHEMNEDEYFSGNGDDSIYCEECYNDRYSACGSCGDYTHRDNLVSIEDRESRWCQHCADNRATMCDDCGEYYADSLTTVGDENICSTCLEDNFSACGACGMHTRDGELLAAEDGTSEWCHDCRNDESTETCSVCNEWTSDTHPCGCVAIEEEEAPEPEVQAEAANA